MTTRNSTLVGVFDERAQAEAAIEQLHNAGIPDEQIRYSGSGSGGFLAGIKSLFTGEDTTNTNLVNDLTGMGLSQDEASFYDNEYRAGRFIVAVNPGERWQDAQVVLLSSGAYNYTSRSGGRAGTYAQPDNYAQATNTGYNTQTTTPDYTTNQTTNAGYNTQSPDYPTQTADTNYAQTTSPDYVQSGAADTAGTAYDTTRSADYTDTDEAQRARLREERLNVGKQPILDQQIISGTVPREKARLERDGDTTVRDTSTDEDTPYNNPDQNNY